MAKRAPSSQPRTRRTRVPAAGNPAEAADIAVASAADVGPTEDEIRTRAYHRYLERGGGHGQDFDDWLEAERELRRAKI